MLHDALEPVERIGTERPCERLGLGKPRRPKEVWMKVTGHFDVEAGRHQPSGGAVVTEIALGKAPHRELEDTMQNHVGIFRNEEDLKRGLGELELLNARTARLKVEGSRLFNPGWHLARDLKSMLTVSEAVAVSAQARKESRGAHSRIDYPNYDESWARNHNIIVRDGDRMTLKQSPVPEMPVDLKEIVS